MKATVTITGGGGERYPVVELDGEQYWLVQGIPVGPVIDGHVFESVDYDATCRCGRSAIEHLPKAMREMAEREIVIP